ncbi:hypothetical protein AKG94_17750 [Vibrio harveyi]|uniref:hypothetical protein n=1 Tax=Vibrio harveyi TaxID=669 RepID=UPI00069FD05B|nr:hypothetical protein [Vibrio harveyi]KNY42078.1 hypothetical protein AKG94_17750 [Vibrio harveyi]
MSNSSRINDLEAYVKEWEESLKSVAQRRERLLEHQDKLFPSDDSDAYEQLRERILEADKAVLEHHRILIRMEAQLDIAKFNDQN